MASTPGKAEKWFHETRKHIKHSIRGRHGKSVKYEKGMEIHTCSYCPKAFSDTRCLVMHILRRHSDNLVLLHENVRNLKNPSLSSTDVIKYIEAEFSDLKEELESVKTVVLDYLCSNSNNVEVPSTSETPNHKPQSYGKTADALQDGTVLSKKMHKSTHKYSKEGDSADFESKLHNLFEAYKKDVILKDVKAEIAVNKREILHEVKNNILPEFQSVLLHHLEKNSSEWKASVLELKRDIAQLTQQVKSNTEKINSPETLQRLEERFELRLLSILNSGSLYDAKKKTKSAIPELRKRKGIFTKSSQNSGACNNLGPHFRQSEMANPNSIISKKQDINCIPKMIEDTKKMNLSDSKHPEDNAGPSYDKSKSNLKTSHKPRKKRSVFTVNSQGLVTGNDLGLHLSQTETENDIKRIVDEKMKCYNIHPNTERLSPEGFEKKMHLIRTETEMLSNSVEGFAEVRDRLELYVDRVAKSSMKAKCPKKLRFSDSTETPKTKKSFEVLLRPNPVVEKEIPRYMSPVEGNPRVFGDGHPTRSRLAEVPDRVCVTPVLRTCEGGLGFVGGTKNLNETYLEEKPKSINKKEETEFNPSTSSLKDHKTQSTVGSSQDFEDLSELSSLSDLED